MGNTVKRLQDLKTVGLMGGICLLFNAMTGPAIPYTASIFATLGFVIPFLLFSIFAVISAFSVLFIIEAMQAIPGNKYFQGTNIEFATLVNFYFGPTGHAIAQLFLYGAIQSQALQSIVLCAQSFDNMLVDIFRKTCGLSLKSGFVCVDTLGDAISPSPFNGAPLVFSIGLLIVLVLCIPLAASKLDDNISVQIVAFCVTMLVVTEWSIESLFDFSKSRVQPLAFSPAFGVLIGPIILNFACAVWAPSWVNLKRTVWMTMAMAVAIFGVIGLFPALGFDNLRIFKLTDSPANLVSILTDPTNTKLHLALNKVFCYVFVVSTILPSIPMCFIVSESNVSQNFEIVKQNTLVRYAVMFICYALPWILSVPMLTNTSVGSFMNFTSILLTGPANFILPFIIYLRAAEFRKEYNKNRCLSEKQRRILMDIHIHSNQIHAHLAGDDSKPAISNLLGRTVTKVYGSFLRKGPEAQQELTPDGRPIITVEYTDFADEDEEEEQRQTSSSNNTLSPMMLSPKINSGSLSPSARSEISKSSAEEFWLQDDVPDPDAELPEKRPSIFSRNKTNSKSMMRQQQQVEEESSSHGGDIPLVKIDTPYSGSSYQTFGDVIKISGDDDEDFLVPASPLTDAAPGNRVRRHHVTMHINQEYVAPTFRAVPSFIRVPGSVIAKVLIGVMSLLLLAVLVLTVIAARQNSAAPELGDGMVSNLADVSGAVTTVSSPRAVASATTTAVGLSGFFSGQ